MIKHPVFVWCSSLSHNPQLLYILLKLSKGEPFIYKDLTFRVSDTGDITVTRDKQTGTIEVSERIHADIVSDIERLIDIIDPGEVTTRNVSDYMVHGYVADCVRDGRITRERARELYNYITVGQILKVFSSSDDISHVSGKITGISGINFNELDISQLSLTTETQTYKPPPPPRMDTLWKKNR